MKRFAPILLVLLLSSLASGYVLDTEHPLYSYMEGIYVFDNRADDGNNIAGTGTMVGTVEDADGFDVPITQTFQSWYNNFGSAYTFCLWHGGWTPGSWSPMIQIHSATDDHSLILSRDGSGAACCLYHQNTQYLFSDLLLTELADPMMFSFTWAASDHVATAYDGNDVISTQSALVTPKTTCTDAGFAIGGTAMTVTRLYIFSTRLTPAQLGALEADPNSIFAGEAPAKADDPDPADEATLVSLPVTLSWDESAGATDYNVYFSKVGDSLVLMGNVDVNNYEPYCRAGTEYQWRIDANNADGATQGDVWSFTTDPNYTITLTGATGVTAVTPKFTFPSGTVDVYVAGSFIKHLTSDVEDNISLSVGQSLEYRCSNWNQITTIDIGSDKVSGDISGWVLPNSLATFYVTSTSVSGDISGWVLPSSLRGFYINATSVSGDISGWVLPSSLVNFYVDSTSVSGDISGWVLPNSLARFDINSTSVDYGTGGMAATWPAGLTKIDADDCGWGYLEVNRFLADCVLSGRSSKQLDIAGTNAGPSQTGAVDKASLQAASWTLSINATANQKPLKSSDPWPTTGMQGVALDTVLTWAAAYDANDYNIYLDGFLLGNTSELSFDPELTYGTNYVWRIDPNYPVVGATTGDLWYFATEAAPVVEPNEPEPEPEPMEVWRRSPSWDRQPSWIKRETGLEGWRKR